MVDSFKYAKKKRFQKGKKYPYVGYEQSYKKKKGKYKISSYVYKTTTCKDVKDYLGK